MMHNTQTHVEHRVMTIAHLGHFMLKWAKNISKCHLLKILPTVLSINDQILQEELSRKIKKLDLSFLYTTQGPTWSNLHSYKDYISTKTRIVDTKSHT